MTLILRVLRWVLPVGFRRRRALVYNIDLNAV